MSIFDTFIGYLQSFLTLFYNLSVSVGFDNYGGAIILMTVVIKMLLYPLTVKQMKSMQQMQKMQPELKKLQQKYKGNPEALPVSYTHLDVYKRQPMARPQTH